MMFKGSTRGSKFSSNPPQDLEAYSGGGGYGGSAPPGYVKSKGFNVLFGPQFDFYL